MASLVRRIEELVIYFLEIDDTSHNSLEPLLCLVKDAI